MCSLRIGHFSDKLENENGERPDLRSHTSYESGSCLPACCSNAPMYFGSNFRGGGGGGERVGMPLILSMICLGENVAPGPREGSCCTSGIGGHKPSPTVTGRDRWEVDENVNPAVCRTRPSLALFLSDADNIVDF